MSDENMAVEIDCSTGEMTTRPLTQEEIDAKELAAIQFATMQAEMNRLEEEREANKNSAIQKLVSLGLTEEEALALAGN